MPAEGDGDLQTLIYVLVARPRRFPTLSNPAPTKLSETAASLGRDVDSLKMPPFDRLHTSPISLQL